MSNRIHSMLHRILYALLPPHCVLCGRPSMRDRNLCLGCEQDLPMIAHSCANCAQKRDASLRWHDGGEGWHDGGEGWHGGGLPRCIYSLSPYREPVIRLITGLKFQHKLTYAQALGELMADKIPDWYQGKPLPDLLIPIPLHPQRMRERGFNQALEIARPIAKKMCIPIDASGTRRIKHTARQSDLPAKKRRENIKRAFVCDRDYSGQRLAIIDDVVTTGQTVDEFCQVLCGAGAVWVDVWCCARV